METRLLKAALAYAAHGWLVLPIVPRDKRPVTRNGCKDATVDPDIIKRWWWKRPNLNIGIATGGMSGILVVDLDGPEGRAWWHSWCKSHGVVRTLWQHTGRKDGGVQLFFEHPDGHRPNRTKVSPGVDVRGDGGYVLAPPSVHPSGKRYHWGERGLGVASVPPALLDALYGDVRGVQTCRERSPVVKTNQGASAYAERALRLEYEAVCCEGCGARNHRLNVAAFNLGQLVGAGLLNEGTVTTSLQEAAECCGLEPREIAKTIRSGLEAGRRSPRVARR